MATTGIAQTTPEPALVRYYLDVQGWEVIQEKEHKGFLFTGPARRPEVQTDLPVRPAVAGG